jgi:uncharacterized membrane protein HdeD (DUF308 family)
MNWQDIVAWLASGAGIVAVVGILRFFIPDLRPAIIRYIVYGLALVVSTIVAATSAVFNWNDPAMLALFLSGVFGAAESLYRLCVGKLWPNSAT